ncbi:MAG: histidine kinase [Lachnospiraceae bacterium]|nr:histidine kinase [Lachnospiraceae bacterium]
MKQGSFKENIRQLFSVRTLAGKIRFFCILLTVPFLLLDAFSMWALWDINARYESMIDSTLSATRFGLDFKENFDYKTYLLIAGDTALSDSDLGEQLRDARNIVNGISEATDSYDNKQRLNYVLKYFSNLETYTSRIENNLREGNKYEECIEIWENDVQIVTTLISDTMSEYIYYEVQDMREAKAGYQRNFLNMLMASVTGFIVILILIIVLSYIIPRSIIRPITEITQVTDDFASGNLSARAKEYEGDEAKVLADSINVMIDKINQLLVQIKAEQLSLRKAEFELLQAQINPHFLYNTLDAIVWLAESGEQEKVVQMVENLSGFFRTSLSQGKEVVPVADEIGHITNYLSIQKVRYHDILNFDIDIADEILRCEIPKLTLQPFVENALYHGIKEKRGGGTISVTGRKEGDMCVFEIRDDGKGMTAERLATVRAELDSSAQKEKSIYGLYNVNQRIRLNYGSNYGITLESEEGVGTLARIILPADKKM